MVRQHKTLLTITSFQKYDVNYLAAHRVLPFTIFRKNSPRLKIPTRFHQPHLFKHPLKTHLRLIFAPIFDNFFCPKTFSRQTQNGNFQLVSLGAGGGGVVAPRFSSLVPLH